MFMSTERRPNESFEDYKSRRKAENVTDAAYLRGTVVHQSIFSSIDKATGKMKMYVQTYRKPLSKEVHLDKWKRRKLRKLMQTAKEK